MAEPTGSTTATVHDLELFYAVIAARNAVDRARHLVTIARNRARDAVAHGNLEAQDVHNELAATITQLDQPICRPLDWVDGA